MKALILNNAVVEVNSTTFEVHPSMTWVDCDDTVKVGNAYDPAKKTFSNPYAISAEDLKASEDKKAARLAAKKSGNAKLLALGLTQEEATSLTGYTPS